MSEPSNYSAIKNALEVFKECIKNGNEIKNLCEKCTNATIKSHPAFKNLVDKIVEDTKAIEKLTIVIDGLQKSADGNDYKKWRSDFGNVVNSLETASNDTIAKVSHAVASSGTKKIKKKFEEMNKILSDTDLSQIKDEAGKNFMNVLIERNQKVVECLKYAESLLPKFFNLPQIDIPRITFKKNLKLFIIGDDSSRSMSLSKNYEHLGEAIIKSSLPSSTGMSNSQSAVFRDSLNGYLIDDLDKTEIMLKLIKAADNSINLMEFANSSEIVKLSATIDINGKINENVEVVEISVIEDYQISKGPEAMAIVENNQTGVLNRVPIQIVPVSPEKQIHGKIIEIQPAADKTEILDDIEMPSFNSTFKEESPMRLPHQFATPSRKDRDVRPPVRDKGQRLNFSLQERRAGIDQLIEDTAEKVVNSIIKDQSILEDVSEIEYANMSSYYDPNQSARYVVPARIVETSGRGNLEDVSEIEYANLSASYHPNQSVRNATIPSPQRVINTSGIRRTPNRTNISIGRNLEDVSEIEYANISSVYEPNRSQANNMSIRSPQRRAETSSVNQSMRNQSIPMSPKSPQRSMNMSMRQAGNLEDISEIEYANLSGSFHPNQSARNQVIVSPQRMVVPRSPHRRAETSGRGNLEDISEIEYANMSSMYEPNQSNRSRGNNMSMASPRRVPETSLRRQDSRLEDISEINYANLSSAYYPNQSVAMSPKSPQRRMNASMARQGANLEDISEIDYADLSGTNQSIRNQQTLMRSPQQRMQTSVRQSPRVHTRQQPTEGVLIDITSTPPKTPQRNVIFNDGNLIHFDNEAARRSASRQPQKSGNLKKLMDELTYVLTDDLSKRLKRREKVHDRSLPYRQQKSVSKMMNSSIPARMPVTSNRIVFDRPVPVQAVPSRIHEDQPVPMTTVVVDRPREVLSPLRPQEAQRINQMLLESTVNPFQSNMLQVPAASRSFYEDQGNISFGNRNTSLPLHLTPRKEKLPAMDQSFTTAWEETQRSNQAEMVEEDLQNISDPFSASMDNGPANEYSYKEDLQNISQPFSESFNEMYDSASNLPQQLPVQSAGQFLSRFDQNDDLENVSFELENDEQGLF